MTASISVLIVDDHAVVRQGVRSFLETQPDIEVVGEASSGEEAVALAASKNPAVILMDLVMPGMNGVEATRQIKQLLPRTQIIILTSFLDDENVLPAVRSGALSYLLKDVTGDELLGAICKAARGEAVLHSQVTGMIVHALQQREEKLPAHDLSERELEVLRLIADGLNNAEIAGRLFISEKTVKSHVSNILGKLHVSDRTQAAAYAWRNGLMQTEK
jgi:NarL family two-component system response regulator LiaR